MASVNVTYEDGRVERIGVRPAGIVAAERHFKGQLPLVEGSFYAAWYVSQRATGIGFEDWLESLTDAYEEPDAPVTPDAPTVDPTPEDSPAE